MPRRLSWIALALLGCADGSEGVAVPPIEAEFALFGTAAEGRAIQASSVIVARTAELESITPERIAGGNVDMAFVGLNPGDFPSDLAPDQLLFVSEADERARPIPNLVDAHVFEEPAPPDFPSLLVPVDQPSVPAEFLADREDRLERMLGGFAIQNPCREPLVEFSVFTPRIPAEAVVSMRTLSSGETFIGFSATSTTIMGVLGPSDVDPEIIGITTSTAIMVQPGELSDVAGLGDTEVDVNGRMMPGEIAYNTQGGFGSVGGAAFWDPARGRYQDRAIAIADTFPRFIFDVVHVTLDGRPQICAFGGAAGSDRAAAIWCHDEGGGPWVVRNRISRQAGISRVSNINGVTLAFDLAGTVYEYLGSDNWNPVFSSALNAGCDPLCANFGATDIDPDGDLLGILGGSKAQLLFVTAGGGSLRAEAPSVVFDALFSDERPDAEFPVVFRATHIAPDGAIWLGTAGPQLFRVSPDRTKMERICLPDDLSGTIVSEIHAHPDGRLILGMSPAIFGFSDWRL